MSSAFFRVSVGDPEGVVRLVRTEEPFDSIDALRNATLAVELAVIGLPRGLSLLIDAREARARNDAEFEAEFKQARRPILAHFARIAVLVKSAAGRLQVSRYGREDDLPHQLVFESEELAITYLTAPMPPPAMRR